MKSTVLSQIHKKRLVNGTLLELIYRSGGRSLFFFYDSMSAGDNRLHRVKMNNRSMLVLSREGIDRTGALFSGVPIIVGSFLIWLLLLTFAYSSPVTVIAGCVCFSVFLGLIGYLIACEVLDRMWHATAKEEMLAWHVYLKWEKNDLNGACDEVAKAMF